MSNPLRLGLPGLVALALMVAATVAALWWAPAGPPVVDAGDLAADPRARSGSELVVTGEWVTTAPSDREYMIVVLRGRNGGRAECHFEDVSAADRAGLEKRLVRAGEVAIRGRSDGSEGGQAVLRGCRLRN